MRLTGHPSSITKATIIASGLFEWALDPDAHSNGSLPQRWRLGQARKAESVIALLAALDCISRGDVKLADERRTQIADPTIAAIYEAAVDWSAPGRAKPVKADEIVRSLGGLFSAFCRKGVA